MEMGSKAIVMALWLLALPLVSVADANPPEIDKQLAELARAAGGTVGVKAVHLESGRSIGWNANERFPMQSVFKLPLSVAIFKSVEEGKLLLSEEITVEKDDLRPVGSVEATWKPGVTFTIEDLMKRMIIESDNSAADILLRRMGGPKAVEAKLVSMGLAGIDISISELRLMAEPRGVKNLPADEKCSPECLKRLTEAVPAAERKTALEAFRAGTRNSASPEALAGMLTRLQKGELLKAESWKKLEGWMIESPTGQRRIRALLPKGHVTAAKTGTGYGCVNDAGVVTLPEKKGHVAIVVFVKHSSHPTEKVESAIAQIARGVVAALR